VKIRTESVSISTYGNFNLCPHCRFSGEQGLLCRRCEGVPVISRSGGNYFDLLRSVLVLPGKTRSYATFFRMVEQVADLLAEKL